MRYWTLASGSSGNATLIENNGKTLLIDIGISFASLETKLSDLGFCFEKIDAVLITHEHSDHIKSIKFVELSKLYGSRGTTTLYEENKLDIFNTYLIASFKIIPFPLSHDAVNGIGYIIETDDEKLVYLTDTGYINSKTLQYLKNATHYLFESNHDIKMLMNCKRPMILKKRILSDSGHLSNVDSALNLASLIGNNTVSIMLIHLSEVANDPKLALSELHRVCFSRNVDLSHISINVAARFEISKGGTHFEKEKILD